MNIDKIQNSIQKYIKNLFTTIRIYNDYTKFLIIIEYASYIMAAIAVAYTIFIGGESIFKYMFKQPRHKPVFSILRTRIIMGNFFIMALSLILAGHIIRFIYIADFKTLFFLLLVILIREVLRYYLEKELKDIYTNYADLTAIQKKYFIFSNQ